MDTKFSFTRCITNRLGATSVRVGSWTLWDSSRCSGLIQVLNCWALSSFSKRSRQESQKVSIADMVVILIGEKAEIRKREVSGYFRPFLSTYLQGKKKISVDINLRKEL